MSNYLKKTFFAFFLGAVITLTGVWLGRSNGFSLKLYCDAFSFGGTALLSVSGLLFLLKQNAFIGIGYAFRLVRLTLFPFTGERNERFIEYKERKIKEKKNDYEPSFLSAGLFYLAVACVFLLRYAEIL